MFELLLSPTVLPWVLIAIGAALLLIEASSPGFFMAVPGTAMIFLGVMDFFFGLEFLASPLGITLTVLAAICAAVITVFLYKKLSPDQKPTTSGQDSIVGKTGFVTVEIVPDSISGKVEVDGVVWSAKCTDGIIPPGTKIEVTAASGVHLTVKKV